jgi:hypothetical protein
MDEQDLPTYLILMTRHLMAPLGNHARGLSNTRHSAIIGPLGGSAF